MIESLEKRGSGSREGRLTWLRQSQSPRGPPVGKAPGLGCAWLDDPDPPGGRREKASTASSFGTSGSAIAEGPREALVSRNPATTNISLENPIVWHYLRDSTFSSCDTIPEWDRHTHRQTDRHTTMAYTALSIASRGKNRPYCTAYQL